MMVGTRDAAGPVSEEEFARQWRDPAVAAEMQRLGVERPEQLGALFIGDAEYLRTPDRRSPALTDDRPEADRDAVFIAGSAARFCSSSVTDTCRGESRFETSPLIARLWPAHCGRRRCRTSSFRTRSTRTCTATCCSVQRHPGRPSPPDCVVADAPVLWRLGSNRRHSADRGACDAGGAGRIHSCSSISASACSRSGNMPRRPRPSAAPRRMTAPASTPGAASTGDNAFALHIYALCMAGECGQAQALIREPWLQSLRDRGVRPESMANSPLPPFWMWMKETFGIDPRLTDARTVTVRGSDLYWHRHSSGNCLSRKRQRNSGAQA